MAILRLIRDIEFRVYNEDKDLQLQTDLISKVVAFLKGMGDCAGLFGATMSVKYASGEPDFLGWRNGNEILESEEDAWLPL
jgi:hypothetical protein